MLTLEPETFPMTIQEFFDNNEYYNWLDIIDYTDDFLLAREPEGNKAHFIYRVDDECNMVFDFDLISHVASVYQPAFERMLKRNRCKLVLVDTPTDFYEKIVKY